MSVTLGRALGAQVQPLMAILMSPRVRTCSLDSGKSPGLRGEYKLHWATALHKSAALRRLGNVLARCQQLILNQPLSHFKVVKIENGLLLKYLLLNPLLVLLL